MVSVKKWGVLARSSASGAIRITRPPPTSDTVDGTTGAPPTFCCSLTVVEVIVAGSSASLSSASIPTLRATPVLPEVGLVRTGVGAWVAVSTATRNEP